MNDITSILLLSLIKESVGNNNSKIINKISTPTGMHNNSIAHKSIGPSWFIKIKL